MTIGEGTAQPRLIASASAIEKAKRLAIGALPRETGGILLGWYEGADLIIIDLVAVIDPSAGHFHYVRNHGRAQETLRSYLDSSRVEDIGYLGEWHSHPFASPPSSIDYDTLNAVARGGGQSAAMVVLAINADHTMGLWGAIASPAAGEIATRNVPVEQRESSL